MSARFGLIALLLLWSSLPVRAADDVALAAHRAKPTLQWCLHHLPPRHSYLPGKTPSGPMVDMMQELATASGFTLTFSPPTPTSRCLKLLEQGKTDLMMGLVFTEARNAVYFDGAF